MKEFNHKASLIIQAGKQLYSMGMVPATSGNLSARLSNGDIAVTVSGRHKGHLEIEDIMRVDIDGNPLEDRIPSAETLLHCQIYRHLPDMQMVMHPHSVYSTIISRVVKGPLTLNDYELLKALPGITSHEVSVTLPVFANNQDIAQLAHKIDPFVQKASVPAYLIAGHGFYTWAASLEECLKQVEALEFLFQCELETRRFSL